jgi:glycosyltransferase involved in cell wall biosynthesis
MRILVVTDQYFPMVGGVPAVTRTLAAGLAQRGHAVTILAPSPGFRSAADVAGLAKVSYFGSFPWLGYPGMRIALMPARAIRDHIATEAPDVVHVHSPLMLGVLARWQAGRSSVPVIYTNHYLPANVAGTAGDGARAFQASFYSWIVGFANKCSYVTAPSATALALLRTRGLQTPAQVVSNGVDLQSFTPGQPRTSLRQRYGLRDDRPVILSVGRLSGEKRLDVLLHAVQRLTQPVQAVIAGAGPQHGPLARRARRLGLTDRVSFLGHVPDTDLPDLYRLADVFAIASEAELQSLATMEAMASGLPVVAADAYALRELVNHRSNGFLFSIGNGDEMARHLDLLAAEPGLRRRMGAQGLRSIARHARNNTLDEWESVYVRAAGTYLERGSIAG